MKKSLLLSFILLTAVLAGNIEFYSIYLDFTNHNLQQNIALTFTLENKLPMESMMRIVSPIQLHDGVKLPQFTVKKQPSICSSKSIQDYLSYDYLSFDLQKNEKVLATKDLITATTIKSTLVADSGKHAYFMWFSQALEANTKYTLVILPTKFNTVPMPALAPIDKLTINQLDSN